MTHRRWVQPTGFKDEHAMESKYAKELFPMGRIMVTHGVQATIDATELLIAICRHAHGDWGDVCEQDRASNDMALLGGRRIASTFRSSDGKKFWVITECDRSYTTILLPNEC